MADNPGMDKSGAIAICRASIEKAMEEAETQEKMGPYGHDDEYTTGHIPPGVTSFEELETIEEASEQVGRIEQMLESFKGLASNVLHSMGMPEEKADALVRLTDEFQQRVATTEQRAAKQVTKTEDGVEYRASDYADVPDPEKPSTWKLRLAEERSGNFTVAQVARAITALQPGGFRGNRVELGQSKSAVTSKISSAISKTDGDDEQKEHLRERLSAVKALPLTGFTVTKALDGSWRWLGWVSNKYQDKEGEIITDAAHKEYTAWLDKHPDQAPYLWTWHIPGTHRKHQADFWAYLNGFIIRGGPLTEAEAKSLSQIELADMGMSHQFFVLRKEGNLIHRYRTFEDSILPRAAAANPWTSFTTLKEAKSMAQEQLSEKQRQFAIELYGEEYVAALEDGTAEKAALLEELGVQSKEDAPATDEPEAVAEEQETPEEPKEEAGEVEKAMKSIAKAAADEVIKALNPEGLKHVLKSHTTAIDNISERLEALEASDDEKVAKEFEPKAAPGVNWMEAAGFRASQSKETEVKEDDPIREAAPSNELGWVDDAFSL